MRSAGDGCLGSHRRRGVVHALATTVVALILLCSPTAVGAATADNSHAVKLMSVGDTTFSAYVSAFGKGILRLTLRPDRKDTFFYEVPSSIVATSTPTAKAAVACENKDSCRFTEGPCVLTASFEKAKTTAAAEGGSEPKGEPTLRLGYECDGVALTSATVFLGDMTKARLHFAFPHAKTLYGLPEHAADLPLRQSNAYEMWNTDAFEYKINKTAALYGSIPFIMAYSAQRTSGMLFLNSADTVVQLEAERPGAAPACDWNSDAGPVDVFFLPGPTPARVQQQHALLTGPSVMPPYFSLGFHQSRWNYLSTKDGLSIDEGFDQHNMPYDVLWLDIEHTNKKKYFTWESYSFPDPKVLTDALASKGRKLVTVKDPHVKYESGYFVHDEALKGSHYIRRADGTPFVGDCWPGRSAWPDFFNARTRDWYASLFHDDRYPGGSRDIHTWVDMNEPSVFKGPRGTMDKSAVHVGDDGRTIEHKHIHNLYALLSLMSVYKGSLEAAGPKAKPERPFILTRGFFPGSQRYAAMWNGDNKASWDHLQNTHPELLSLSLSNYPFCGCDIGGFFGNTEEELYVRWLQAGVFYPFMRAHAHLETKRREPWTFSADAQHHIRNALALRYSLIPYLYTTFFHAHRDGETILRPLFYEFPAQENLREVQDTFMFGPALLVAPVVHAGATTKQVVLPQGTVWYSYQNGEAVQGTGIAGVTVPVQMESIPLYIRGGHVVPVKLRLRRNTAASRHDPFTLLVALNGQGNSYGDLYLDDGTTYDYQQGAYAHRHFSFSEGKLTNAGTTAPGEGGTLTTVAAAARSFTVPNKVERVVVLGLPGHVSSVTVSVTRARVGADSVDVLRELPFERVGSAIVVRKPDVGVQEDWVMAFHTE